MTNEEAIHRLDDLRRYRDLSIGDQKALATAIQALENQSEDCISREDALMALTGEWTDSTDELIHRFIRRIKNLPSVNPQLKTGHWILLPSNKEQEERDFIWWKKALEQELCEDAVSRQAVKELYYKCSECGQVIYSETEKNRREYHAFCGRCGAKMVEPQERSGKE